jgi:tetratricopeptide (TPR) repeat protein
MADEDRARGRKRASTFTRFHQKVGAEELAMLEKKLTENPDNFDLMDWAAFAFYSNGLMEKAIGYYERLVRRFPNNPSYHYYLGNAEFRTGKKESAVNHWQRVLQLDTSGNFSKRAQRKLDNKDEEEEEA